MWDGFLLGKRYLIHDRDPLFTEAVRGLLRDSGVKPLRLPANSPNLNAYAERFVLSIRRECLDRFVPLSERHLRTAVTEYVVHYHTERNHQGLGNELHSRKSLPQVWLREDFRQYLRVGKLFTAERCRPSRLRLLALLPSGRFFLYQAFRLLCSAKSLPSVDCAFETCCTRPVLPKKSIRWVRDFFLADHSCTPSPLVSTRPEACKGLRKKEKSQI